MDALRATARRQRWPSLSRRLSWKQTLAVLVNYAADHEPLRSLVRRPLSSSENRSSRGFAVVPLRETS